MVIGRLAGFACKNWGSKFDKYGPSRPPLASSIGWQWESFAQYLDAIARRARAIDIGYGECWG